MSARSVCCRGSAVREPPVNRRKRWSSLPSISSTEERAHPRRRQLDGERNAVEVAAQRRQRRSVVVGDCKIRAHQQRTIDEELHRFIRGQALRRLRRFPIRQRQRRHSVRLLAGDAERFAAARQDLDVGALSQECVGHFGAGIDQVLAVVEQQQQALVLEVRGERLSDGLAWLFLHPQNRRHGLRHETGVRERRELHEPGAVRELLQ